MSLDQITDEVIARQALEARSIIRLLLAEMAAREERMAELEAELVGDDAPALHSALMSQGAACCETG